MQLLEAILPTAHLLNFRSSHTRFVLLSLFCLLLSELAINFFAKYNYDIRKNQHLVSSIDKQQENFNSIINSYSMASEAAHLNLATNAEFKNILKNVNKSSDFKKAHDVILDKYQQVYNLNRSHGLGMFNIYDAKGNFLARFQKQELYGDNVLKIRKIISKVHETKKSVNGFESGKYYNAFRFVYPVMEGDELLGIIELAFDESAVFQALNKTFATSSYFAIYNEKNLLIDKNISNSYIKDYDKKFIHHNLSYSAEQLTLIGKLFDSSPSTMKDTIKNRTYFAFDGVVDDKHHVVVGVPLHDFSGSFAGYFTMYQKDILLETLSQEYYILLGLGTCSVFAIWLGIVILFLYYRRAKAELSHSKTEQSILLENLAEGVFSVDNSGICIFINQQALDILGYEHHELIGKPMHDLIHSHKIDGTIHYQEECSLYKALQTGVASDGEDWFIKKGNVGFPVYFSVAPIYFENVRNGAVTIFLDITERKHAEEKLVELNRTLEARVEEEVAKNRDKDSLLQKQSRLAALGEMIGNIAHQWRQPLNALAIRVQDVPMAFDHEELDREYIDDFKNESMSIIKHMSQTIDDFRNFFLPDKQKMNFSVKESIARACSLEKGILQSNEISVELDLPESELVAFGYPNEFSQVLLNIINNAKDTLIEKRKDDRHIGIEAVKENEGIVILIKDNAFGVPEDILDKIFDPYFTTKHKAQGTGLGLYMSKMIIEQNMGGKLSAYNTAEGACFEIRLLSEQSEK
jgi:PAS domain S-box-containing protein